MANKRRHGTSVVKLWLQASGFRLQASGMGLFYYEGKLILKKERAGGDGLPDSVSFRLDFFG